MLTREEIIECYMINEKHVIAEMLFDTITKYEAELEEINSRICCENCQQYESLSKICYQNGCKDYEDWILWKPKESNGIV